MKQTTLQEVIQTAASGDYRLIPVCREILADIRTPLNVLRALQNVSDHCFLLESAEDARRWGRYTFLGYEPKMELFCKDHQMTVKRSCCESGKPGENRENSHPEEGGNAAECFRVEHPGDFIKKVLEEHKAARMPGMPPLTGGLVGFFAYDYIQYGEPTLHLKEDDRGFADLDLMLFDKMIAFDHLRQKIILIVNVSAENPEQSYIEGNHVLDEMEELVRHGEPKKAEGGKLLEELKPALSKEAFSDKVRRIKEYIHEGDIFQLVFSNPMQAKFDGSLLNMYRILRTTNPSPYMFYFSGDTEIAGASPETLVKVENGTVRTFPLAGTRPRGKTPEEDRMLEQELLSDEKERAEHNMLVDLGRNDLGRLCGFGTVDVEQYMTIERYSHVMHIGSAVKGVLRDDVQSVDAIDAVLPAGTLSGAPKIRACELIDELEDDRRGIYGGAIGYVDFTGNLDVCIAIRLAYKKDGVVYVRSGAGIVADSVPENEYQECINKAGAVAEALKAGSEVPV